MRHYKSYLWFLLPLLLLQAVGCLNPLPSKTSWNLTLDPKSRQPYGLYLTANSLPHLFPGAAQHSLKSGSGISQLGYQLRREQNPSLVMLVSAHLRFSAEEVDSLLSFAAQGHYILLSASNIDTLLLQQLELKQLSASYDDDKQQGNLFLDEGKEAPRAFPYPYRNGFSGQDYFSRSDTGQRYFYQCGTNAGKQPDFIAFSIGRGKLFLHASPIAFTNYFLLQDNNREYLDGVFSYIPGKISQVYFGSFLYRETDHSKWRVILQHPSTRYALILTLIALAVYLLFETKRRQRILPVVPATENTSVAFVETIGRLYYNKSNHRNLAEKMTQHFLEYVRSNYYINTSRLDQEFTALLAAKSGKSTADAEALVHTLRQVQAGASVDEAFLYSLHNQIQHFYHGK